MDYFIFNKKHSFIDSKIVLSETGKTPQVKEVINNTSILGKSGTVTERTGIYNDIVIERKLKLWTSSNFKTQIRDLNKWLTEIEDNRLILSDNTNRYYKVKSVDLGDVEKEFELYGVFVVKFICEPFIFDVFEREEVIVNNSKIFYAGDIEGEPIIKFLLPNNVQTIQFTLNDETIQINNASGSLTMDCQKCMFVNENNQNVSFIGNFYKLKKGYNSIKWIGGITNVAIFKNTYYKG